MAAAASQRQGCHLSGLRSKPQEGLKKHGEGFLVARITGIVSAPEDEARRFMVTFDEWAPIKVPDLWQFGRNPVHYADLDELGIDESRLRFKQRDKSHRKTRIATGQASAVGPSDKKAERSFYVEVMVNPHAIDPPRPQNLEFYRVALLELQTDPEIAFEAENARSVLNWTREWLREPIDLAVGIHLPGMEAPAG